MTPTELLEMLKGWPVEARPVNHWATVVGTKQHAGIDSMHIDHAVDLACMAGLRWLIHQSVGVSIYEQPSNFVLCDAELGADIGSGSTILHAIDAAIRATKG